MRALCGGALLLATSVALAGPAPLFTDEFATFDATCWAVEAEDGAAAAPYVRDHALYLDSARGLTVWFRQPLTGSYEVDFTRTVLDEGQPHDRVSDLNLFWLAQLDDTAQGLLNRFGRSGQLDTYNGLRLFYAGIGGNGNTTTRFRYYDGTGARGLLQEYLAAPYLLTANHPYRIRVVVDTGGTALYVDGQRWFEAAGPLATRGYFAFRTTKSRQKIEHFAVYPLTKTGTPP